MNQLEIEQFLDELAQQTESEVEEVFNKRLQTILNQVARMCAKYADKEGELSWTDVNRYNRLAKELQRINQELTNAYKEIIETIQESTEYIYLEGYMRNMYLYEMTTDQAMRVSLPSMQLIRKIIKNPIAKLTLPETLTPHRNEIVRRINIEISQGIQAGEGYAVMAKRLENAVKFSQNKARTVVRTETGRVRSISGEKAEEQAKKYVEITGVWLSALDLRVRHAHRELDGKETDEEGYFHYRTWKAKGPHLWGIASMDINCRCVKLRKINGMLPEYRRGRNYMDPEYQHKLADRIEDLMSDRGLTYKQALKQAQKVIKPPSTTMEFVTFNEWYKKFAS
ncbi:phage minor head protein [Virgibacillus halodenitrificans]|uniref:Phage head morphogenesis protein n=1 Tax=Virgibacillus halodenitrificans TaxID=1482 RepID=A0ABR7VRU9_VIRHA|nr:phage minor head protein [Virgibacillus halodenitrificans]MBD1223282.1 phage head morphogenesis protein [Virgibacillus halodenitrificans]